MDEALQAYLDCPKDSRDAVLSELAAMALSWNTASNEEAQQDAATLAAICTLLSAHEKGASQP